MRKSHFYLEQKEVAWNLWKIVNNIKTSDSYKKNFCKDPEVMLEKFNIYMNDMIFDVPLSLTNNTLDFIDKDYPQKITKLIQNYDYESRCAEPYLSMETRILDSGLKKAMRVCVNQSQLPSFMQYCRINNHKYLFSPYSVNITPEPDKAGFSNLIDDFGVIEYSESGFIFAYVAHDWHTAVLLWISEVLGLHDAFARLLGYPECCIDFYKKNITEANLKYNGDFVQLSLYNTISPQFSFYTNNLLRYFDLFLVSHFPCSYDCIESIMIGKQIFDNLLINDRHFGEYIRSELKLPIIYTEKQGIHVIREYQHDGNISIDYSPRSIYSTNSNSYLSKLLLVCNKIEKRNAGIILYDTKNKRREEIDGARLILFI